MSYTYITNWWRDDGFGAHYQTIICTIMYAELTGKKFVYTPFWDMQHNYSKDPEFLQKKERFINIIDHFPVNHDYSLQPRNRQNYIQYCDNHVQECVTSSSLKLIKQLFRSNKISPFDDAHFHVAIHIRRYNEGDGVRAFIHIANDFYKEIIVALRNKYCSPRFHIYSQGSVEEFRCDFDAEDIQLHLNESIEDSFSGLVFADALVICPSSFSYCAGQISQGAVYYFPFWHPPYPNWISCEDLCHFGFPLFTTDLRGKATSVEPARSFILKYENPGYPHDDKPLQL